MCVADFGQVGLDNHIQLRRSNSHKQDMEWKGRMGILTGLYWFKMEINWWSNLRRCFDRSCVQKTSTHTPLYFTNTSLLRQHNFLLLIYDNPQNPLCSNIWSKWNWKHMDPVQTLGCNKVYVKAQPALKIITSRVLGYGDIRKMYTLGYT